MDEPISELLGNIEADLIKRILERYYGGDESKIPTLDYIGAPPFVSTSSVPGVVAKQNGETTSYSITTTVPPLADWLNLVSGPSLSWLRSLLTTRTIVQGSAYLDNPLQRLFSPRKGQVITVTSKAGMPVSVVIKGSARSFSPHQADFEAVRVSYDASSKKITVIISEERTGSSIPLELVFLYRPDMGYAPIHEVAEGRNTRIKQFYWKLWFGDDESLPPIDLRDTFTGPEVTISEADIHRFCTVVGNDGESFKGIRSDEVHAPMDFAIVTGWQVRLPLGSLNY